MPLFHGILVEPIFRETVRVFTENIILNEINMRFVDNYFC